VWCFQLFVEAAPNDGLVLRPVGLAGVAGSGINDKVA
jgi:hypothetical protein